MNDQERSNGEDTPSTPDRPMDPPGSESPPPSTVPPSEPPRDPVPVPPPPPPPPPSSFAATEPTSFETDPDELDDEDMVTAESLPVVRQALGYGISSIVAGALALYLFPGRLVGDVLGIQLQIPLSQLPSWYLIGIGFQILATIAAAIVAIVAGNRVPDIASHVGLGRIGRMLGWAALILAILAVLVLAVQILQAEAPPAPQVPGI